MMSSRWLAGRAFDPWDQAEFRRCGGSVQIIDSRLARRVAPSG